MRFLLAIAFIFTVFVGCPAEIAIGTSVSIEDRDIPGDRCYGSIKKYLGNYDYLVTISSCDHKLFLVSFDIKIPVSELRLGR